MTEIQRQSRSAATATARTSWRSCWRYCRGSCCTKCSPPCTTRLLPSAAMRELACIAFVCVACGPSGRDDGTKGPHLEIKPADFSVTITNGGAVAQAYTATRVDQDGNKKDVTGEVTFAVADPAFGSWS